MADWFVLGMLVLSDLVDSKTLRVLETFLKNRGKLFHLQQISSESKVPTASVFRIVRKLVKLDYITITRIGKLKVYSLADNIKTKSLGELR